MSTSDHDYKDGLVVGTIMQLTAAAPAVPPNSFRVGEVIVTGSTSLAMENTALKTRIAELEKALRNSPCQCREAQGNGRDQCQRCEALGETGSNQ